MAISLVKGQTISLVKDANDLSLVTVGLGWDVRQADKPGLMSKLLGGGRQEEEYDLDVVAFMLDGKDKITNYGNRLIGGDVIFYNSMKHPSGTIWLTGDNRTGAGDGDDEQIVVQLTRIPPQYEKILFIVQIYEGINRRQQFGMIDNAFIRAVDARGVEMAKFNISNEPSFQGMHSIVFAELYRHAGGWKFRAIGEPRQADSFVEKLKEHLPS